MLFASIKREASLVDGIDKDSRECRLICGEE